MSVSSARTRYNRAVLLCSAGYGCALIGGSLYFRDHPGAHGAAAWLAGIAPGLLIVGIFVAIGRYLAGEQDEYLRQRMVRQILVATGVALSLSTVWGFLESFGLVAHLEAYWIAVIWFGGLGLGACVNTLADRRGA